MLLMHYVLAGAAWLTGSSLVNLRRSKPAQQTTIAKALQDWLPFALGGAITAGVAPLLFVQILYQREFYTANLLLSHRWMSILPILILAFYLLYLQKSTWLNHRAAVLKPWVWLLITSCFLFVGYSWTENHLLSLQKQDSWTTFFAERRYFFARWEIPLRLAIWLASAFTTLAAVLAWQLCNVPTPEVAPISKSSDQRDFTSEWRGLRTASFLAIGLSMGLSLGYFFTMTLETRTIVAGPLAWPYILLTVAAWGTQIWIWWRMTAPKHGTSRMLLALSAAVVVTTLGMNVIREAIRLAEVDLATLFPRHADAANVGGAGVFLFFLILNAGVMVWVVRQVVLHLNANGDH